MTPPPLSRRALVALPAALALSGCLEPSETTASSIMTPKAGRARIVLNAAATRPPGTRPLSGLLADLPETEIVSCSTHAEQVKALASAKRQGFGIVVVQAIEPDQIGEAISDASDQGPEVVALETVPASLQGTSLVVAWDEYGIGERQVQGFHRTLTGKPPHHLEFFGGAPDDRAAQNRFTGAIKYLFAVGKKEADLVVKSGQTTWATVATADQKALDRRLSTTYEVTYPRHVLDGLVLGHDSLAPQVIRTCGRLKKKPPVLLSSDATVAGVTGVMGGSFHSTILRDPALLAGNLRTVLETMRTGGEVRHNPQAAHRNHVRGCPGVLPMPTLVTRQNAAQALAGNPVLAPLARA